MIAHWAILFLPFLWPRIALAGSLLPHSLQAQEEAVSTPQTALAVERLADTQRQAAVPVEDKMTVVNLLPAVSWEPAKEDERLHHRHGLASYYRRLVARQD